MINFILSNDILTLILNGRPVHLRKDNPLFIKARHLLADPTTTEELMYDALNLEYEIICAEKNIKVTMTSAGVLVNGQPVHEELERRVIEFRDLGLPTQPLLNFIEKLYKNPNEKSQHELLDFLCHHNLPIHEDGDFLAYKAVAKDYTDIYSGKIDNSIGESPSMPRSDVDNNCSVACSKGLHAGTIEYAKSYGGSNCILEVVKINPMDAVSVPRDWSCQKIRICKYHVYGHYTTDLTSPVYSDLDTAVHSEYADLSENIPEFDQHILDKIPNDGILCLDIGDLKEDYDDNDDEDYWDDDEDDWDDDDDDGDDDCNCTYCQYTRQHPTVEFGTKPNGQRFYNRRGPDGKFTK